MRTLLAPHVRAFLENQLSGLEGRSPHTVESYTTAYVLLFKYMSRELGVKPAELAVEDFTSDRIGSFLTHLEKDRGNCERTRNARLAAVKRLFGYIGMRVPQALEVTGAIEAMPAKRFTKRARQYLRRDQVDALLGAPCLRTRWGKRDHAMLALAFAAGLRVSELVQLKLADYDAAAREVRILGKGRRERTMPLWKSTADVLDSWLAVRPDTRHEELFLNRFGRPITRHGFASRVTVHAKVAAERIPMPNGRVTPHTLRHSSAMNYLEATGDIRKVSLWLGHECLETTQEYLHADPAEKLEMMAAAVPPRLRPGVFPDAVDRVRALFAETAEEDGNEE